MIDSKTLNEKANQIALVALDIDGVMTDGRLYYDERGERMKAFYVRDGFGIRLLKKYGIAVAIVSGRGSPLVYARAADLGIDPDLVFLAVSDKGKVLDLMIEKTGLPASSMAFIGDDWIDLPLLLKVGLSVAVADAHPELLQRVDWITRSTGGWGAVRELAELILQAKGWYQKALLDCMKGE